MPHEGELNCLVVSRVRGGVQGLGFRSWVSSGGEGTSSSVRGVHWTRIEDLAGGRGRVVGGLQQP